MIQSKILSDYSRLADAALEVKALSIAASMTGNANFPQPNPGIDKLNEHIAAFSAALSAAKTRHLVSVSEKNDRRRELIAALTTLATYISYVANGNRTLLLSSGFSVNAENKASAQLGTPGNFKVEPGQNSGSVVLSIDAVANARSYTHFYKLQSEAGDTWFHAISSSPEYTFTGLDPLKMYCFRIGVAGAKGQVVYTDIITKGVV